MKKQQPRSDRPQPLKWEFAPGIPTYDFIKDYRLDEPWGLKEALDNFTRKMERGDFLTWEAVVAHEQGLALTEKQEAALGELLNFGDPEDEQVLYIDEIPRTSEPWHAILNEIVSRLLIEPFRTFDIPDEVQCDGWKDVVRCLRNHATDLSLPENVSPPIRVIPLELRHKLWLQDCFNTLSGLGQEEELTLEDPDQHYRIDDFIGCLQDHKDTVHHFGLTLDSLMERVILPEKDRPIFVQLMQERLDLKSAAEQIAQHLGAELTEQEEEQRLLSALEDYEQEEQRLLSETEGLKRKARRLESELEDARRKNRESRAEEASLRRQYALQQQQEYEEEALPPPARRIGRNDPCPCGSGKKFKKCCIHKQDISDLLD